MTERKKKKLARRVSKVFKKARKEELKTKKA